MTTKAMFKVPTFWVFTIMASIIGGLAMMGFNDLKADVVANADENKALRELAKDNAAAIKVNDTKFTMIQKSLNKIERALEAKE